MNCDRNCQGRGVTNTAQALRLVLAALDRKTHRSASIAAFSATRTEFDECPACRRAVFAQLSAFAADRLSESPTPERWDRYLIDRIADLLDLQTPRTAAAARYRCGLPAKTGRPCRQIVGRPGRACAWHRSPASERSN